MKKENYFNLANLITFCRIVFSVAILVCKAFSIVFFAFYIMAGLSDIFDGIVARNLNLKSEFGSKLDTVADFIFFVAVFTKLFPFVRLDCFLCVCVAMIAFIKIFNVVIGFFMTKELVVVHSFMNKIAGALLFLLPFGLTLIDIKYGFIFVCIIASLSAIFELKDIILTSRNKKEGEKENA